MNSRIMLIAALLLFVSSNPLYATYDLSERVVCGTGGRIVALLVDPALRDSIRSGLEQFESDLCSEGYSVYETRADFTSPPDVRAYLSSLNSRSSGQLNGSVLIGNVPYAYQWVTAASANPSIPSTSEEVISYQYYTDLDGVFSTSPAYHSPGNHQYSFDIHSGDVDWEIWIGVLPYYQGNLEKTADAIRRYFTKNHDYRTRPALPRVFLEVNELNKATTLEEHNVLLTGLRSGQYAWTPFSNSPEARIYFDSTATGLSVDKGYADLAAGIADFTVVDSHGYWGAGGKLDIAYVVSKPIRTYCFWSNGCAVGDLDRPSNFLTAVLYSPTSSVVVAKGTTNNSGGMGNNGNGFFGHNIATALSANQSFGQALLAHVNAPLISPWSSSREFHFATAIVLGDPTLKFGPRVASVQQTCFSHVAIGGGYTTSFTLVNSGSDTAVGSVVLTGQSGQELNATLSDGMVAVGSFVPVRIPPGGANVITATGARANDPTSVGWARVETSGGTVSGVATFEYAPSGFIQTVAGVLSAVTVSAATIPVNDKAGESRYTGYAVANPGSSSITIKVQTVNPDGTPAATLTPISLPPGGQIAKFLTQDPKASPTFQGSLVLIGQNGAMFSAVALAQVQGQTGPLFTAIPVIAGKPPSIN